MQKLAEFATQEFGSSLDAHGHFGVLVPRGRRLRLLGVGGDVVALVEEEEELPGLLLRPLLHALLLLHVVGADVRDGGLDRRRRRWGGRGGPGLRGVHERAFQHLLEGLERLFQERDWARHSSGFPSMRIVGFDLNHKINSFVKPYDPY